MDVYTIVLVIAGAALLGLIPAYIVRHTGRNFLAWWIYGTLLFVIAAPHAIYITMEPAKRCPFCHTNNRMSAPHCKRCGYEFVQL